MSNTQNIIIGQEAICPDGLGRVLCLYANDPDSIKVNTYMGVSAVHPRSAVTLIPPGSSKAPLPMMSKSPASVKRLIEYVREGTDDPLTLELAKRIESVLDSYVTQSKRLGRVQASRRESEASLSAARRALKDERAAHKEVERTQPVIQFTSTRPESPVTNHSMVMATLREARVLPVIETTVDQAFRKLATSAEVTAQLRVANVEYKKQVDTLTQRVTWASDSRDEALEAVNASKKQVDDLTRDLKESVETSVEWRDEASSYLRDSDALTLKLKASNQARDSAVVNLDKLRKLNESLICEKNTLVRKLETLRTVKGVNDEQTKEDSRTLCPDIASFWSLAAKSPEYLTGKRIDHLEQSHGKSLAFVSDLWDEVNTLKNKVKSLQEKAQ